MTLRTLPEIHALAGASRVTWEPRNDALERWNAGVRAAEAGADNVISIYDVIGEDFWTGEGFTSKRMASALRAIGPRDVVVNINSPGGDFFEGVAIYNLLREHKGAVTINIMGLAASAASIIAMAGDTIRIGRTAFVMIHNAWGVAMGNRHDFRAAADTLEPFDQAMADLYAARSGMTVKEAAALMDAETWFSGSQAVERRLADALLSDEAVTSEGGGAKAQASVRQVDRILARHGVTRRDRNALFADLRSGTRDAAEEPATRDAGLSDLAAALRSSIATVKG